MSTQTLDKTAAVEYFKAKLEFEIGPYDLKSHLDKGEKIQVVDLRTEDLYKESHVPTAIHGRVDNIDEIAGKLNKDATIVVYCYNITCQLSTRAALHLAEKGFKVKELYGGWEGWVEQKLSTEPGTKAGGCCAH